ncbi:MAG: hypothetical protein DI536_31530 [Archangium gephyra]|uniref:Uncharacterized protein n=1 Tax=Archangium gephyra TaxID=48 RepID=A0A2W5SWA3_9BACT|nr:MAG: hypothetical protein DI536_31530 [Archangium gephyra]
MNQTHGNHWHATWYDASKHGSAWERVKEAMKRDWEQTKKDFKVGGTELNQDVTDTVKQAVGKEPIPPRSEPNWETVSPAYEYGYTARQQFGSKYNDWNDSLENDLRSEWEQGNKDMSWAEYKAFVRRGYDYKS